MVAVIPEQIYSEGLYTVDQAARLARVPARVLRRWLDGGSGSTATIHRRVPRNDAGALGFIDLIQVLAIRAIRNKKRLSLQKIRQTIDEAEKLGIQYPFARKHQTYLFADDVVLRLPDDRVVQVTGKYTRQDLIKPVVELYMDDLVFDEETGLAAEYTPLREGDRKIVINPTIKFGAPIVYPSGYAASTLIDAVESEGSIKAAAEAFAVSEADVKIALRYDDLLAA